MDRCLHWQPPINTSPLSGNRGKGSGFSFHSVFLIFDPPSLFTTLLMSSIFWCRWKDFDQPPPQSPIVVPCCHVLYFLAFLLICHLLNFNARQAGWGRKGEIKIHLQDWAQDYIIILGFKLLWHHGVSCGEEVTLYQPLDLSWNLKILIFCIEMHVAPV